MTEAPPTAESELTANWPTASLSSSCTESSLNPETKSLQIEKKTSANSSPKYHKCITENLLKIGFLRYEHTVKNDSILMNESFSLQDAENKHQKTPLAL